MKYQIHFNPRMNGDRVVRYPHVGEGLPEPHWNLVDKTTGVNIHVIIAGAGGEKALAGPTTSN
jgi:hypothetical protein